MAAYPVKLHPQLVPHLPRHGLTHWVGVFYVLLLAFPYLQWMPLPSYNQPVHLPVAVLLFLVSIGLLWCLHWTDAVASVGLALTGLVLFVGLGMEATETQPLKYLLSFVSPLLLGVPAWQVIRSCPMVVTALLRWAIGAWVVVALLQTTVSPTFATFLLGQWGEYAEDIVASGRGVLGLAPEPTHHAFHVLLLAAAMVLLDTSVRGRRWAALAVFDAVFLAGSSSAMLVLGLALVTWFLRYRLAVSLLVGVAVVIGWSEWPALLAIPLGDHSRAHHLLVELMANPSQLLIVDHSVNMRLGGLWATLNDVVVNGGAPRGMSAEAWEHTRVMLRDAHPWLVDISGNGPPSGVGMLLYQGGWLVLLPLAFLFGRVLQLRGQSGLAQVLLLSAPLIFLSQFYLSAPAMALLYGAALHRRWSVSTNHTMDGS